MPYLFTCIFCLLFAPLFSSSISISSEPFASLEYAYSPPSVPIVSDKIPRMTSSSVSWFDHDHHLVVTDFINSSISIYRIDEGFTFECIQHLKRPDIRHLINPVDTTISPDERFLAITNYGYTEGAIAVYAIDPETHTLNPDAVALIPTTEKTHGLQFSPDGRYLAFTTIYPAGHITIYRFDYDENSQPLLTLAYRQANDEYPLCPKAVTFSPDMETFVIGYSLSVADPVEYGLETDSKLVAYAFDKESGAIGSPLSSLTHADLVSLEDVLFSKDGNTLFVSNTMNDALTSYPFDRETATIGAPTVVLKSPEAQIYHPHGFNFSADDRYLAVTNNDYIHILMFYQVTER